MLHTLRRSPHVHSDSADIMTELVQSALRNLILVFGGGLSIWFIVATATWPEAYGWSERGFVFLLIGICGLALWLLSRHMVLAQVAWQVGMMAAITLGVWLFHSPEIALFYILLPFVAAVTAGWPAFLIVQSLITGTIIWLSHSALLDVGLGPYAAVIGIGGICAGLLGSVIAQTLFTAMESYVLALARAEENLEAVRQHRGQLMRMQKSLDDAYYQLKRTNSALTAAWQIADEAQRFKAEFVANVSHELRTPLNLIVGFSEVIMTSPESYGNVPLPGVYRRDLNAIYYSGQHLLALVDDVLDLARIEVGKLTVVRNQVDLMALVEETTTIVSDYITAKGLDMQVNITDDLPIIWIDRLRIRQVLLNLLVNAARYTDRGHIRLEISRSPEEVIVRVTDSGRGIPAQDLPKIFEEFRTTEEPMSTWHSGTGLGLPISKKFVELNGGRMGVESIQMQGTSFWFTLPCKAATAHPAQPTQRKRFKPVVTTPERVLVIVHEDSRVAPFLQRYLDGYQLLSAVNLSEGIGLAATVHALAVVTDEAQPLHTPPGNMLIVCCPLPSGFRAAHSLGANNLLVKPVSRHELEAAVNQLDHPIRRILIADDDPEMVRVFKRMLSARVGIEEWQEAFNGEEALRLMRSKRPDLVLLDLIMPGTDGHSVLEQMASDPALADIPVIVISAKGQDYLNLPLPGAVQISKSDGFQMGEVVRMLDAILKALAPGWYPPETNGSGRAEASADSTVWSDTPSPPTSLPTPVHSRPNRQSQEYPESLGPI